MSGDNGNSDEKKENFQFPLPSGFPSPDSGGLGGQAPGNNLIHPNPNSLYMQDQADSGAVGDQFTSGDVNAAVESSALQFNSGTRSPKSLCDTCIHCWSIRKDAGVMNLDENGKPFLAKEGFCTVMPQSLFTLNDRNVQECNKWEAGGRPRTTLEDT